MRAPVRIAAFVAALGVTFGTAALAGAALDPLRGSDDGGGHAEPAAGAHGGGHGTATVESSDAAQGPVGLGVADGGYVLAPDPTTFPLDRSAEFRFRILDSGGEAVTDFDVEHEREMHLIVVRRDLSGYQHLHPARDADGRWSVRLRLPTAGVYRAYADFGTDGRSLTLATDLFVAGAFRPVPLSGPSVVDETADGYRAELSASRAIAGQSADLAFGLSRDGRPLRDIEPYLGADGHLVALREGDLAFLHAHPEESRTRGTIRFGAALPSAGRYRLFLQFKHEGRVRTVAHTLEVTR